MLRRTFLTNATLALCSVALVAGARAALPAHEQTRIARLIAFVESQKGMTFVRNGSEYSCADAAKFLRGKLDSMGGDVTSAHDFIERIGSRSSLSGEPYRVKFADGKVMLAGQFLADELKRIDAQPA